MAVIRHNRDCAWLRCYPSADGDEAANCDCGAYQDAYEVHTLREAHRGAVAALEEARALIETAEQDGYIGPGWREDAQRWQDCWSDTLWGQ